MKTNMKPFASRRKRTLSMMMLVGWIVGGTACQEQETKVKVYAAPEGIELSAAYQVTVEGQEVPIFKTKVATKDPVPRLNHSRSKFGFASFGSFDMGAEAVQVTVTYPKPVDSVKILPSSFGIEPTIAGNTVSFEVAQPQHLTIEFNGDWHESLHIFANPMEQNVPSPDDPNVIYYGPGVHEVTHVEVKDGQTVYLAGGAYLRAVVDPDEAKMEKVIGQNQTPPTFFLEGTNMTIRGRGIIDQSAIPKKKRRYTIFAQHSDQVSIEGVTIVDPSHWTIPLQASDNLHVDNVKIIGWRGNSDGVDISNSRTVLVENCFMRTLDDAVVVKSFSGKGEVRDIHTRKIVVWNELAHALSIGAEIHENVSNILFEDCDVIHDVGRETALRIYHCDDALISDVTFQNIRVEEARRLISGWIGKTRWTESEERGNVRNVLFKDIVATSAPIDTTLTGFQDGSDWKPYIIRDHASMQLIGFDEEHTIEGVIFDNVVLDGKKVTADQVTINEFVKDVSFE
ncbi:glycosyl hydrolase family 28 protein [Reichenbachiella agariperforans]|uniref:glycosyl hydrolase family 28 protein n=1 Tax=Reichenbachiella agariperforans TaxID=156994 RepID=UPI001C0A6406|nr:glycosyl hydrolase family 28 protein [Reichenbachiella agariperforans]MBU2914118.1 right-handed parallel beta-helix repeat-containing protein [Reichenbachiella agariperforans]